jgi:hypothetical protein
MFGTAMQRVCARDVAGHAIELCAEVATEGVASASLWLRADDAAGRHLAFDNMSDRALRGTTGPTRLALTLRVPPQAVWLGIGVLHVGGGRVTAQRLALRRADGVPVAVQLQPAQTLVMA